MKSPAVHAGLASHRFIAPQDRIWFDTQVPSFECPSESFERLWYYRWEVVRRHLKFPPELGCHLLTEFESREQLYWAGPFNTIVGASDHHVNEARWLRDPKLVQEFVSFWLTYPTAQRQNYSSALADSVWAAYIVHGNRSQATALLEPAMANHENWIKGWVDYPHDNGYDAAKGLFWNTGRDSSGEYNLASAQLNEPLRGIQGYKIRGGAGYRPDINADMFADKRALSRLASLSGRTELADSYRIGAAELARSVHQQLWDNERQFFMHRWLRDEYSEADRHGQPTIRAGSMIWETNADRFGGIGHQVHERGAGKGREAVGFLPWYRHLAEDNPTYAEAWKFLIDPAFFKSKFGPTTAEQHDPWFSIQHDCRANGNSFPLVTSRVLNAAGNLLHDYTHQGALNIKEYIALINDYVETQQKDGEPYLAEFHHPHLAEWVVDRPIGFHYFHSSFCDLVITGLLGLRPRPDDVLEINPLVAEFWDYFSLRNISYHGHQISIQYDRVGEKYRMGPGLKVWIDGELRETAPALQRLRVSLRSETVSSGAAGASLPQQHPAIS